MATANVHASRPWSNRVTNQGPCSAVLSSALFNVLLKAQCMLFKCGMDGFAVLCATIVSRSQEALPAAVRLHANHNSRRILNRSQQRASFQLQATAAPQCLPNNSNIDISSPSLEADKGDTPSNIPHQSNPTEEPQLGAEQTSVSYTDSPANCMAAAVGAAAVSAVAAAATAT